MFSHYELEFLKVVLEDLRYLKNHWYEQQPTDEEIRRNAVVLRRLLVNNDLQKAWKLCGFNKEPIIIIPNQLNTPLKHPDLVYAQNAGANLGWGVIEQVRIYNKALQDDEIKSLYEQELQTRNEPPSVVGFKAFLDAATIVIKGQKKTRRQLIKYVANRLGGAHFEEKNRDNTIDSIRSQIRIGNKDPVFLEVLSIAQSLMISSDIQDLMSKCEQIIFRNSR